MLYSTNKSYVAKRYARLVLALFVLSILNMGIQIPTHAAMKMAVMDMSTMGHQADMKDMSSKGSCHCPPPLCDSVLAIDNQAVDGVVSIHFPDTAPAKLIEMLDQDHGQLNQFQHFALAQLSAIQTAPPPLSITTILHI